MNANQTIVVDLNIDLRPALAAVDAFIAALTDMRDRLEAEIETLLAPDMGSNGEP